MTERAWKQCATSRPIQNELIRFHDEFCTCDNFKEYGPLMMLHWGMHAFQKKRNIASNWIRSVRHVFVLKRLQRSWMNQLAYVLCFFFGGGGVRAEQQATSFDNHWKCWQIGTAPSSWPWGGVRPAVATFWEILWKILHLWIIPSCYTSVEKSFHAECDEIHHVELSVFCQILLFSR